eukprot:TRINITY_DN14647_c0_g1_i1.p1 TRINITY_DN14647_c0_g1~~TRINITY_DN14647_c0_g1_i1.p1  ORF type:complete len:171 (-),score=21.82 TRINITY_DN14647_c0_g1_i1:83-595(-)
MERWASMTELWEGLQLESNSIQSSASFQTFATSPNNFCKNRYRNVLPTDHSRVVLGNGKDEDASYVNANWIQPTSTSFSRYIATQAPIYETFKDFWQMIYENKIKVILMLTRLEEGGSVKADEYWLDEGEPETYNNITVTLVEERQIQTEITLRYFSLFDEITHLIIRFT